MAPKNAAGGIDAQPGPTAAPATKGRQHQSRNRTGLVARKGPVKFVTTVSFSVACAKIGDLAAWFRNGDWLRAE